MSSCNVVYLPKGISDQYPIKIILKEGRPRSRKELQFCNVWTQYP